MTYWIELLIRRANQRAAKEESEAQFRKQIRAKCPSCGLSLHYSDHGRCLDGSQVISDGVSK